MVDSADWVLPNVYGYIITSSLLPIGFGRIFLMGNRHCFVAFNAIFK